MHIILIHPAGECSGQHLLSPGERVSEITKCAQSNLLYFLSHRKKKKKIYCGQKNADRVPAQLYPMQYS